MSVPCPMGHGPVNRGQRRRMEREVDAARLAPGVGKGWRLTNGGRRRYRVREPESLPSVAEMVAESDAVARRLGCTCAEVARG